MNNSILVFGFFALLIVIILFQIGIILNLNADKLVLENAYGTQKFAHERCCESLLIENNITDNEICKKLSNLK